MSDEKKEVAPALALGELAAKKIKLTEAQERLLEVLRDKKSLKMTVSQICNKANISRGTYYNSLEDQSFLTALESAIQSYLRGAEFSVLHNIINKATDPETQSHHWALMVMKLRGRLEAEARQPAQVQVIFNNVVRPKIDVTPGKVVIEGEIED
jgi:hypothetical protein